MATFSATAGQAKVTGQIDDASDEIAAGILSLEGDPTLNNNIVATGLKAVAEIVNDRDAFIAFAAGTHTQGNSGQPAKALGTGSPVVAPTTEKEAVGYLLGSGSLPVGIKAALRRILVKGDPDFIEVGVDGTPTAVGKLEQELMTARADLQQEKDASYAGSLAQQLAAARAAKPAKPLVPGDMVAKASLAPKAAELKKKVAALSDGIHRPGTPSKKADALAAVDELIALAN